MKQKEYMIKLYAKACHLYWFWYFMKNNAKTKEQAIKANRVFKKYHTAHSSLVNALLLLGEIDTDEMNYIFNQEYDNMKENQ